MSRAHIILKPSSPLNRQFVEKLSSTKPVPGAKTVGDRLLEPPLAPADTLDPVHSPFLSCSPF